jgi:hypothetical protein
LSYICIGFFSAFLAVWLDRPYQLVFYEFVGGDLVKYLIWLLLYQGLREFSEVWKVSEFFITVQDIF